MKNLILLFALTLFSISIFAQDDNTKIGFEKQPRFAIKTHPASNFWGNFKLGVEYVVSEKVSYEIDLGSKLTTEEEQFFHHVQIRGKRSLTNSDKTFSGVYIAAGINAGQWVDFNVREGEEREYFATIFSDIGIQYRINRFILEGFTGVGLTTTTADFSESAAGCVGCGTDPQANSLNLNFLALRLGARVGYAF